MVNLNLAQKRTLREANSGVQFDPNIHSYATWISLYLAGFFKMSYNGSRVVFTPVYMPIGLMEK